MQLKSGGKSWQQLFAIFALLSNLQINKKNRYESCECSLESVTHKQECAHCFFYTIQNAS